jgi:hypothetical protein
MLNHEMSHERRVIFAGCAPGYGEPIAVWQPTVAFWRDGQYRCLVKVLGTWLWVNEDASNVRKREMPSN